MKKKKVGIAGSVLGWSLVLLIGLAILSPPAFAACAAATKTILLAGQTIAAGSVTAENDGQSLYINYRADAGWLITESHLAIASRPEDLPQTPKGNAVPGRFAYQTSHDPAVAEVTHTIDISAFPAGTKLYIAAHCVLVSASGSETAWGQGHAFPGKNWAMYFTHTIQACEPPPRSPGVIEFDRPDVSVQENGISIILHLMRHDGSDGEVSATFGYEDLSATQGDDYYPAATTVTFGDGETEKMLEVFILDDQIDESDEPFRIRIESVTGAEIGAQREMTCTILDDDETPRNPGVFSFASDLYYVDEGAAVLTVEVLRTDGSDGAATVDYLIRDETATSGSDYQATSGALAFAAGETVKQFEIMILDDAQPEADETFRLELTNPMGATIGTPDAARVLILDNDGQPPQ